MVYPQKREDRNSLLFRGDNSLGNIILLYCGQITMNINENILKITGGAYLNKPLNREQRARISTEIEVYDVATPDNQDGTYNQVFKTKIVDEIQVEQLGQIITGKPKNSYSQRFRGRICAYAKDELGIIDTDAFYETFMKKAIVYVPELCEYFKNKS